MKKTTFIVVSLLVIALTAGLVLTGCPTEEEETDSLNGTWVNTKDSTNKVIINNGSIEFPNKMKGTFTTSGDKITITPTHIWGSLYSLEAKWYSKDEFKTALKQLGSYYEDVAVDGMFVATDPIPYSVSGTTLTISIEGQTSTYTKQ